MSTRASQACAAAALGLLATLSSAVPVSAAANAPTGNFSTANAPTGDVATPGAPATDTATAEDIRDIRGPKGLLPPWLLPALLATLFGLVTFRLRIKGVFFALITQVLILALYLVVVRNLPYTGGDVGMIGLP